MLFNAVNGNSPRGSQFCALQDVQSAFAGLDGLYTAMGFKPMLFKTVSEYVSTEVERPSLFQNLTSAHIKRGTASCYLPERPTYRFVGLNSVSDRSQLLLCLISSGNVCDDGVDEQHLRRP